MSGRRGVAAREATRAAGTRAGVHVLRLTPHFYWPQLEATSWPVKYDAMGGMQVQIHRLVAALAGEGVRNTVLTLRIPGAPARWRMCESTEVRGVRVPVLPLRSRIRGMVDLNVSWALGVLLDVAVRRHRPDVVHVHCSGVMPPLLVGWLLRRLLRTPLVLTLHCSVIGTYHPMNGLDRLLQPVARWVERRAVRAADRTVTLTERTRPRLVEHTGRDAGSFVVLPDGIEADAFAARATPEAVERFRERFSLPRDRRLVGYVGRVAREKGWPALVDVAERLAGEPVHWVVCGDGNELDLLLEQVRRRGLADRFTVTGYIPNGEVPAAMATMEALLLPSLHEEFGSVTLEAMAVGLPVVGVEVGGLAHVMEYGKLGRLVPERDPDLLAGAVLEVLADEDWRRRTTRRAARAVRERYDITATARALAAVYREVAAGAGGPREALP